MRHRKAAIQRDPLERGRGNLKDCANKEPHEVQQNKCKVLHLGCNSFIEQYGLGTEQVRGQLCRKGVVRVDKLDMSQRVLLLL